MDRKSFNRWIALNAILVVTLLPLILVSFQNCAPMAFSMATDDIASKTGDPDPGATPTPTPAPGGFALKDQMVRTSFSQPKTWTAEWTGDRTGYTYSFDFAQNTASKTVADIGVVEVVDPSTWTLKFTPVFGFRGELQLSIFARKADGNVVQANLKIQVGNAVNLLAPALAIRGTGCITCHAEVHSNMVTDFGYTGDGAGRNYYFGGMAPATFSWNDGMVYGDQDSLFQYPDGSVGVGAWWSVNLVKKSDGSGQKVYVPAAALPSGPANATGASTLRGYLQHRMNASYYDDTHSATAVEKSTVYIGAPSASRLQSVFNWTASDETKKYKFIADAGAAALSGFNLTASGPSNGKYFTNTGTVVCEGDLMLKGTLYLNNLSLKTRTGCRLYVTGSVFIYGPITYVTASGGDYSKRNLQISSSKAILMGLGSLWKNGNHCEQGGEDSGYWGYYENRDYWTEGMNGAEKAEYDAAVADSAKYRLTYFWGLPAFFFRNDARTGQAVALDIYNEMVSTVGTQQDAACRAEGRNVRYDRLLLNAPLVESRYAGGFSGSIIAEIGLMSLGLAQNQSRFKFEFDPVFQEADILPLLTDQDFLHVE
jgi:hypothetical protein